MAAQEGDLSTTFYYDPLWIQQNSGTLGHLHANNGKSVLKSCRNGLIPRSAYLLSKFTIL